MNDCICAQTTPCAHEQTLSEFQHFLETGCPDAERCAYPACSGEFGCPYGRMLADAVL